MADIKAIKAIREELLQTEIYYTKLCRKTKQEGDKAKYEAYKAKKISLIKKIMEIDEKIKLLEKGAELNAEQALQPGLRNKYPGFNDE